MSKTDITLVSNSSNHPLEYPLYSCYNAKVLEAVARALEAVARVQNPSVKVEYYSHLS